LEGIKGAEDQVPRLEWNLETTSREKNIIQLYTVGERAGEQVSKGKDDPQKFQHKRYEFS